MKHTPLIVLAALVILWAGAHATRAQTLAQAVDATNLVWTTGGNASWLGQTQVTHDGVDAARSGAILDNQYSWLETTVAGPGTLGFWWKVSSEYTFDFLEFYINGSLQSGRISGEWDWEHRTFALPAGAHTLRWRYVKDSFTVVGQDRGWVDEVGFAPDAGSPGIIRQPQNQTNFTGRTLSLSVTGGGALPLSYQWRKGGVALMDGGRLTGATGTNLMLATAEFSDAGAYSVVVSNSVGVVTSRVATVTVVAGPPEGHIWNPTPAFEDFFGYAVSAVGTNKLLIGAPGDDYPFSGAGVVHLFSTDGSLLHTFANPELGPFTALFGGSVTAVGTDKVLIGAELAGPSGAGAAYLFDLYGTLLRTIPSPTSGGTQSQFGSSVAAVGPDKVLIGAEGNQIFGGVSGRAYLFDLGGTLLRTFTNPAPSVPDFFGAALVAVGTNRVLIGAYGDDTTGPGHGAAYLFDLNGTLLRTFTHPEPSLADRFGYSVTAVGDDKVLIGSQFGDSDGVGGAYLFEINGTLLRRFTNSSPELGSGFGSSVAAAAPDKVLIGAPYLGAFNVGAAYLFDLQGTLLSTFNSPVGGNFGSSVAAVGIDKVLIGASEAGRIAAFEGAAYLFPLSSRPSIVQQPQSRTNSAGTTVIFSVTAGGTVPLTYRWHQGGVPLEDGGAISGAITATVTLSNVQPVNAGNYTVVVSNSVGSVTSMVAVLTVIPSVDLSEALDATDLTWTTAGHASWIGQGVVTHDGVDAAQNGALMDNQESRLETTVTGPGTLQFWWKVSSEAAFDFLEFYIDGVLQSGRISGEVNWQQRTFTLPAGTHTLRWRYFKDESASAGQDSGWVDEVIFGSPFVRSCSLTPCVSNRVVVLYSRPVQLDGVYLPDTGTVNGVSYGASQSEVLLNVTGVTLGSTLTIRDVHDQQPSANLIAPNPTVCRVGNGFGGFEAGFDDNMLPPGTTLFGIAVVADDGTGNRALRLTGATNSSFGVFVIPDQNGSVPLDRLLVRWKSRIGGGSRGADGYSFNWANDLPVLPTYGNPGEEGAGTGLSVTIDTWDNSCPADCPTGTDTGLEIKWNGVRVAYAKTTKAFLRKDTFVDAEVLVNPNGSASFTYDGVILQATLPGFAPIAGGRFMFGARTGGANDNHWIDDICINAFTLGPVTVAREPQDQARRLCESICFAVRLDGVPPYEFQWKKNGVPILGATSPQYCITYLQTNDAGRYSVCVTNECGFAVSREAVLAVDPTVRLVIEPPLGFVPGGFRFSLCGPVGTTVRLQRSTNLQDWTEWRSVTLGGPLTEVTDPEPGSFQFYRAVAP
jgi:hypothetical protein